VTTNPAMCLPSFEIFASILVITDPPEVIKITSTSTQRYSLHELPGSMARYFNAGK